MRKLLFCLILAVGGGLAYGAVIIGGRDWGTGIVAMFFGVVVAAPIGSLLTGIGRPHRGSRRKFWRGAGFSGRTGSASDGVVRSHRWDR